MPQTKGNCAPTFSDKASKCAPSFCQCIKDSDSVSEQLFLKLTPYWECFMGQNEKLDLNFHLVSPPCPPCRLWWYFSNKFVKKNHLFQFSTCPSGLSHSQWPSFPNQKTYFRLISICLEMMLPVQDAGLAVFSRQCLCYRLDAMTLKWNNGLNDFCLY